ncbi:MAG: hypothetical protein VX640_14410 [Pseudomonadota bacterium]|nr:hypothetical protein [Pseudomonadota bacterium]
MSSPALSADAKTEMRLFDSFSPGQPCGRAVIALNRTFTEQMKNLLGPSLTDDRIHMAAVPLLLMRAFTTVVGGRPPGNLHVGQVCELFELPGTEAELEANVVCLGKEKKRDRKILRFEISLSEPGSGRRFMSGVSTIFWAA